MRRLAQTAYDRRRLVVAGWIALLVGLFALSSVASGEYSTDFALPGSESQEAFDLLESRGVDERSDISGQIVFRAEQGVDDPAVRAAMEPFFAAVEREVAQVDVVSPYEEGRAHQVSPDGAIAYAEINFSQRLQEEYLADAEVIKALRDEVTLPGLRVELGGDIFADAPEFSSEAIGLLAAIVILLIAFGSLLAMGLPIVTALVGIGCGVAIVGLITRVLDVPDFTSQVALMIGIGVGIDYSLLIVTRYRAALHDGLARGEAVVLATDTSGRAVVFAGLTVVISLLGIMLMNLDMMRSMAIAASLAVLMTMLAAVTLLPALLGFVGRHIDRLGLPHRASRSEGQTSRTFWYRWSRVIQAHPWPAMVLSTALLIVLAVPIFSMRLGFGDAGNRLEGDTSREAYDLLSEGFGPGVNGPVLVLLDGADPQDDAATVGGLLGALESTEGVASIAGPVPLADGSLQMVTVFPTSAPQDAETTELVHRLRDETLPQALAGSDMRALTTGMAPAVVDFSDYTAERLPYFVGAVLLLSFLLLLAVFHSVVVPVKAVAMNLLSIGAAFGAMVAVFQWGYFDELFGLGKEGPIEAWAPMMLFAIVFGLSMDYEVFLLTRVREEYDRSGDNSRAVADGLAATGRVISAAALIMVCVFGSFVLGSERALKLMGFGLAFAILVDATVVRLVLVPALMELMGRANWWAPSWLVRILPRIRVEPEAPLRPAAAPEPERVAAAPEPR